MVAIGVQRVRVEKALADGRESCDDVVAVEEPLEIRVLCDGEEGLGRAISVTMRTPGNDTELALGFLHGEGLLRDWRSVRRVRPAGPTGNVLRVELQPGVELDLARLQRNFYTSSSCGVCGKAFDRGCHQQRPGSPNGAGLDDRRALAARLAGQAARGAGGIFCHGRAARGRPVHARRRPRQRRSRTWAVTTPWTELVGSRLAADALPLANSIVLLSGRASFELVQKAGAAGVPLLAAIGAPSSLAIELAEQAGITLVAFLRDGAFNIYTHGARLR